MILFRTKRLRGLRMLLSFQRALAMAFLAMPLGGCHLGQPSSGSFASVVIQHHSAAEIAATAEQVFRENGYAGGASGPGQMVFNKEGSRANTISRDGLIAAQAGATTIVRVRAELVDLDGGSHRLQCHAFMVSGAGDSFFEDEHRLANFRSRPYQKLLDEVAKRLKQ
jgi:hypothetical protein